LDISTIGIAVDTRQLKNAESEVNRLGTAGGNVERKLNQNTKSMMDGFGGVTKAIHTATAALAAMGVIKIAGDIFEVNRETQKLKASLVTVTGSIVAANMAWADLEKFATTTPYSLQQSISGFVKMKALGLDPTESALRSFGNTAAAMGKDLNQMIEAVADASTSEFERLKEFGIKAKQEGDRVTLTFQGVKTEIGNNATEITRYLENIGNTSFAGSMDRQMDTLNGQVSNLGDNIDSLFRKIGDSGGNNFASGALAQINNLVSEASENLDTIGDAATVAAAIFAGRLAGSVSASAAAMVIAQVEAVRYQAALASMAGVSRGAAVAQTALAGSVRLAGGAMALVGGPVGVAVIATAAIYAYREELGLFATSVTQTTPELEKLRKGFEGLTDAQLESQLVTMRLKMFELEEAAHAAAESMNAELEDSSIWERLNPLNITNNINAINGATQASNELNAQQKRVAEVMKMILELRDKDTESTKTNIDAASKEAKKIAEKINLLKRENDLLRLGYDLEDAKFIAAYAHAGDMTKALMRQQREQQGIIDAYKDEADVLARVEDAQKSATQAADDLVKENNKIVDGFLNAEFGSGLTDGFNDASRALSSFVDGFGDLINAQEEYNKARAAAGTDAVKIAGVEIKHQQDQVSLYGDMAAASKQFFSEGSSGYKNLQKVEQAFRAAELAYAVGNLGVKLGLIEAETVAHVAANGIKAASSAVAAAVSSMVGLPFPLNLAALGATVAAIGALGVNVFGGGGGGSGLSTAQQAQQNQGTGTVLGDSSAKSDSAFKALELMEDHLSDGLQVSNGMLFELRSLNANITGLGNLLGRQLDFGGGLVKAQTGYSLGGAGGLSNSAIMGTLDVFTLGFGDDLDKLLGGLFSGVGGAISSKKTSKVDEGLQILGGSVADIISGGVVSAFAYAEILTKKSKLGSGTKSSYSTITESLGAEISGQFGQVISSIYAAAFEAVDLLGIGDTSKLTDFGGLSVSTFGLSSEDAQKEVQAVLGAFADSIALTVVPSLLEYQNVGEGLFETLSRVATQTVIFKDAAAALGLSLSSQSAEQTLHVANNLAVAAGGLAQFADNINSFTDFILTDSEKFAQTQGYAADMFERLGVAMPASTEALKTYVAGLDLSTIAHQEAFTAITSATDLLDDYYSQLEDYAKSAYDFDTALGLNDGRKDLRAALAAVGQNLDVVETAAQGGVSALGALFAGLSNVQKAGLEPFTDAILGLVPTFKSAADIASERLGLENQLLQLLGDTDELRRRERESLDKSNRALYDQINAIKDQKSANEELARSFEQLRSVSESISDYLLKLDASQYAGTPEQQAVTALDQFRNLASAALGGDVDAAQKLTSAADAAISLSKDAYASGAQFQSIYEEIKGTLGGVVSSINIESYEQQQLALLQEQLDAINNVRTSAVTNSETNVNAIGTVDSSVDGLNDGLYWWNTQNLVTKTLAGILGVTSDALIYQREIAKATLAERYGITYTDGNYESTVQQFGSRTEKMLQAFQSLLGISNVDNLSQTTNVANAFQNLPAFADGGVFTNSIVSSPTRFNMAEMGEAGPEAIMPLHRGADGSLGVRGNVVNMAPVVAAIESLRAETQHQTRIQAAAQKQLIDQLKSLNGRVSNLESEQKTARLVKS